ncbi:glycosyltransferase family 2 protein [Corynebacterium choanae]|uniref:4,4'-diaponeurosporenoate glycosyltransferase n=1 Tax=Corynebacterium choanae TaxID=1862358 RepID=A0A3G6J3F7_9CORY|nr:glycosyltransferase family A protein [Corynebacterium choanae]AZA12459.1 Poly-beta-1,6-N-acetyl-D-glucosamine synthase [Corynebacterium choanae]
MPTSCAYTPSRRLSVVIPCLNDAALLETCLQAFAQQQVPADEIIVVDNGSTDHSAQVAKRFGATVVNEPRRGITFATKTGFDAASGDVLLRTDTDVVPAPDFVLRLHQAWDFVAATAAADPAGRTVVGVTGDGRFLLPGWRGKLATNAYMGAYRKAVGFALGHQPLFGTNYCLTRAFWTRVSTEVDFTDTEVHEDMHISFAVRPDETVWVQHDLVLPMDARALVGSKQVVRRFARGMHTIVVNWRKQAPWVRLAERGVLPDAVAEQVRSSAMK